jgi:thiamine-monophosphate kinase
MTAIRRRGEFGLIDRLAARLAPPREGIGIGDDAAVWRPDPERLVVATTDMLVEGVHFRLDWTTARDLGWKALAVSLSDLAAMGASPGRALVSIALLAEQADLAEEIYDGMAELARLTGTTIVGGDTVRTSGPLVINVALLGEAAPDRLLLRNAGRPGDLVAVTGIVGASAAALELLLAGDAATLSGSPAEPLIAALHRPFPQLEAGAVLARHGVLCAIDISDGVASEAWHLARSSGVEIAIDVDRLPLAPEAVALLGPERARTLALTGGEDYQLLFTVPEHRMAVVAAALPEPGLTVIGRVTSTYSQGRVNLLDAGVCVDFPEVGYAAF